MSSELTRFGFKWGNVELIRMFSHERDGKWLLLATPRQELQVRVTKSGLIRVGLVQKRVARGT